MCGIIGQISFDRGLNPDCSIAIDHLKHRGPDFQSTVNFSLKNAQVSFGHTRLSIIDTTSAGNQPMISKNGRYCIVFNGEIYNYLELRKSLSDLGYSFTSNTDTEVLLIAYEYYGDQFISKLDGMFSFAILDKERQSIVLGRDPFGKKPLYYFQDEQQFAFSSEITALKKLYGVSKSLTINKTSISQFYIFGFIPQPNSIFNEIKKIKSGNVGKLKLTDKSFEVEEYWNPFGHEVGRKLTASSNEIIEEADQLVTEAVRKRLVADVPICSFLSGGLDSSIVLSKAIKLGANLKSFTISFPGYKVDESTYAQKIAMHLGVENQIVPMYPSDMTVAAQEFLERVDEPIGDAATIPLFFLAKNVSNSYKVAIGGDGGDEIFGGYSKYRAQNYLEKNLVIRSSLSVLSKFKNLFPENIKRLTEGASLEFKERQFVYGSGGFLPSEVLKIVKYDKSRLKNIYSAFTEFKGWEIDDAINRSMSLDCKYQLPDWYLAKADRATMAASIELRSPLLDKKLTEYMFSIPGHMKLENGESKYILKKIAEKTIPHHLIYRPKLGFSVDFESWVETKYFKELLYIETECNPIDLDWIKKNEKNISPLKKMRIAFMNHYLNKISK